MAKHNFRVGDEFEGSPIQLNHWVTPVWAAGGRVEFDGETATIVYLPEELEEEVAEVEVEAPSPVEEKIVPVVEEWEEIAIAPGPVEELEKVAVEPELVEEVPAKVAEEPALVETNNKVSRGRPKKIIDSVDKVE